MILTSSAASVLQLVVVPSRQFLSSAKVINAKGCSLECDPTLRENVLVLKGDPSSTRIQLPREDRPLSSMHLKHSLLTIQINLSLLHHFALEITMSLSSVRRIKLIVGTNIKEAKYDTLLGGMPTLLLPLLLPKNKWIQVVLHVAGIVEQLFGLSRVETIDSVALTGAAKVWHMMSSSDEQACIDATPDGFALFAVPAYAPPIWSTAGAASQTSGTYEEPSLSKHGRSLNTQPAGVEEDIQPAIGCARSAYRIPQMVPVVTNHSSDGIGGVQGFAVTGRTALGTPPATGAAGRQHTLGRLEPLDSVVPTCGAADTRPPMSLQSPAGDVQPSRLVPDVNICSSPPSVNNQPQGSNASQIPSTTALAVPSVTQPKVNGESQSSLLARDVAAQRGSTLNYVRIVGDRDAHGVPPRAPSQSNHFPFRPCLSPSVPSRELAKMSSAPSFGTAGSGVPSRGLATNLEGDISGWEDMELTPRREPRSSPKTSATGAKSEPRVPGKSKDIPKAKPNQPSPNDERLQRLVAARKRKVGLASARKGNTSATTEKNDSCSSTPSPRARRSHRARRRMQLLRANEKHCRVPQTILASEVPLTDPLGAPDGTSTGETEAARSPTSDAVPSTTVGELSVCIEPRCGYGFGYLGVLREDGNYEEDESVDLRMKGALSLALSDDDDDSGD